jgi:hypothetical protein
MSCPQAPVSPSRWNFQAGHLNHSRLPFEFNREFPESAIRGFLMVRKRAGDPSPPFRYLQKQIKEKPIVVPPVPAFPNKSQPEMRIRLVRGFVGQAPGLNKNRFKSHANEFIHLD